MAQTSFTDRTIAAFRLPEQGQVDYYDVKMPGFGMRVSYGGAKTWFIKYVHEGRQRRKTLGQYPAIKLAKARELALGFKHELIVEKRDPALQSKVDREALTLKGLAELYIEQHAKAKKRSWKEDQRILNTYFVKWHNRKAVGIERTEMVTRLQDIKNQNGGVMANRCLACIRKVYNWGYKNGFLQDPHNPAYMVDAPASEKSRDRFYTDHELVLLWDSFGKSGVQGSVYKFALISGQRLNEIAGMKRSEITDDKLHGAIWMIPGERTKNGEPHIVPLSTLAVQLIADVLDLNETYVFASPRGLDQPVTMGTRDRIWVRKLTEIEDFTPHDLRRTFRTNVTPLGFAGEIGERVLNHTRQGVEAVYDRYSFMNEKRDLMEAWARHIEGIVGESGNIVQLKGSA